MNNLPPLIDEDGEVRELTAEDMKHFRPIAEVMPPEFMAMIAAHEAERKTRGKQKTPLKQSVTLRLSPEVVSAFKAGGKGWQTRINQVLLDYVAKSA